MSLRSLAPILLCLSPVLAFSQQIPQIRLAPIATGLNLPVEVVDDGTGRLFVVEQDGQIVIVENGQIDSTPFLDIHDEVSRAGLECGLIGLAFHPDFKDNHKFYVDYVT